MRRLVFIILVSFLLLTLLFVRKESIPPVKASPDVYQGDLVLTGNNVTVIEGRFDINGSIIVEENASLILRNSIVNVTGGKGIYLQNPVNGNPRLQAENTTILASESRFYGNSSIVFSNCSSSGPHHFYDEARGEIENSTLGYVQARGSSVISISSSTLENLDFVTESANASIANLSPGFFAFWNFQLNCSVNVIGSAPNVTLTQTTVNNWGFSFQGFIASNQEIVNSDIWYLHANGIPHISVYNSTLDGIELYSSSVVELVNSTHLNSRLFHQARIYVNWYLSVHVTDSIGQDVPVANVTATYSNATVAESKSTNANGWARLTLMEKMMNATDSYPVGNYTVTAKYEVQTGQQSVNITGNKEITIQLPFILPEFPSYLILPLFVTATLLAVIIYRRKYSE